MRQPRPRIRRLIPAHAGSTGLISKHPLVSWAHPRSRGEHRCSQSHPRRASGSSPLTRGALKRRASSGVIAGLIPAHAGSTLPVHRVCPGQWAHPRSRGEHLSRLHACSARGGSSPLTRGALPPAYGRERGAGLIPAHAGSTKPLPS